METEAGTWNRKRMEAQKRDFKKERNGYALEAYPYMYIYKKIKKKI